MTDRQVYALARPAWPGEKLDPGLRYPGVPFGSLLAIAHMPVEDAVAPVWHATVSLFTTNHAMIVPVADWKPKQMRRAEKLARELLLGVGDAESDVLKPSDVAIHLFRLLNEREVKRLDPDWLAEIRRRPQRLPAV